MATSLDASPTPVASTDTLVAAIVATLVHRIGQVGQTVRMNAACLLQ